MKLFFSHFQEALNTLRTILVSVNISYIYTICNSIYTYIHIYIERKKYDMFSPATSRIYDKILK